MKTIASNVTTPQSLAVGLGSNNYGVVLMLKNSGAGDANVAVNVGASSNIVVPVAAPSVLAAGASGSVTIPANYQYAEINLSGSGFSVSVELAGGGN